MKKLFILAAVACSVAFSSCKNNDPEGPEKYEDYPYSSLSVEQQKDKLAQEANSTLDLLIGLADEAGFSLIESLTALPEPDPENLNIDFENGDFKVNDFKGEYTWNATNGDWDFKDNDKMIVLNFPSTKGGKTNDAKIELTGVASKNTAEIEGSKVELPQQVKMVLKKDNNEVGMIEINAEDPNAEKVAKSADMKASFGSYSITFSASQDNNSKATSSAKISKGSQTIVDGTLGANIDWEHIYEYQSGSTGSYNEETQEYEYEYEYTKDTTVTADYVSFEISLSSNLAVVGSVDFKNMDKETEALYEKYDGKQWSDINEAKKYYEERAAINNKYTKAVLISKSDKTKIADLKSVAEEYEYDRYECKQDGYESNCGYVKAKDYHTESVLVFGDKSEATMDAFFGDVYEKFESNWIKFLEKFGIDADDI